MLVLALAAPAAAGDNRGSAEEAQDMVARAIAYYDEMGAEAAVARFNADPAPEFLDRDLYIFVVGPEGTVVAHGSTPRFWELPWRASSMPTARSSARR